MTDPAREAPETSPTEEQLGFAKSYSGCGCTECVGKLALALSRREAEAEERGVRRGLEAAAKWHEERAKERRGFASSFTDPAAVRRDADDDEADAAAIRALEVPK